MHFDSLADSMMVESGAVSDDSPSSSDHSGTRGSQARPNRDPMSHRMIEKRRRDRMNNCLANLSKLIPPAYLKKGRGRVEKTEIIEMGIRYMRYLQDELKTARPGVPVAQGRDAAVGQDAAVPEDQRYKQGFHDCIAETLRYFAGAEGQIISQDSKARMLVHLNDYFNRLGTSPPKDEPLNMSLKRPRTEHPKGPSFHPEKDEKGTCSGGWSSQYPSSPGSSRSFSDVSSGGSFPDSPPRVLSPPHHAHQEGAAVPIFALHGSGQFYVPLSVGAAAIGAGMSQLSGQPPPACHPVTITVHFAHQGAVEPPINLRTSPARRLHHL